MSQDRIEPADEFSVLLNALAEVSLSDEQERRLAELLRADAAFRREYVRYCQLLTSLAWQSPSVPESMKPAMPIASARMPPARTTSAASKKLLRVSAISLGIAATVIAVALVWRGPNQSARQAVASVTGLSGRVEIIRAQQPSIVIRAEDLSRNPWPLQADDRIQTEGGGSATLILADQTEIRMGPETHLVVTASPNLILPQGRVTARVTPQPAGNPLTFVTPRAEIHVLGTELELLALDRKTEIAVSEGRVRVIRTSDQRSAQVTAAQFLSVEDLGDLAVLDWPRAPDDWIEDFERGLPSGWTGRMVQSNLPAGSRGAVQAIPVTFPQGRGTEVSSPVVEAGLFAWHSDSVLHLTFKVEPPAWFHVFMSARGYDRSQPSLTYCCVKPDLWQSKPGEWRTVSIPLSEFHLAKFDETEATLAWICTHIAFSGSQDLAGVVLDRVAVDRSGTLLSDNDAGIRGKDQ
jgi:ferric-dicitrate binding protein FerR (iron transport regulator)